MLVGSPSRIFEWKEPLLKQKPIRESGQDVRTLPSYTIPEAAMYLAIDPWTLLSWYSGRTPLLKPSGWYGDDESFALLSFNDVEEAYKVQLLRTKFAYSMQYLRDALPEARKLSRSEHPLIIRDFSAFTHLAMHGSRKSGKKEVSALGAPHASFYIKEVIDAWGKRIVTDSKGRTKQIFPWRYAKNDDVSRPVSLDPEVLSGRLVVTGTRIPVSVLLHRRLSGDKESKIAKDYNIRVDIVAKALKHIDKEM